jgi:hypothetical protein
VQAPNDDEEEERKGPGTRLPETDSLAEFYLQKAEECRVLAANASDEGTRDEWLKMANGWIMLARHSDR